MAEALDGRPGDTIKLWDAAASLVATDASDPVYVPASRKGGRCIQVHYFWGTAPSALSMAIQRSPDNSTWTTISTITTPLKEGAVSLVTSGYVRAYITTNTGGDTLTLSVAMGGPEELENAAVFSTLGGRIDGSSINPVAGNADGGVLRFGGSSDPVTEATATYTFMQGYFKGTGTGSGSDLKGLSISLEATGLLHYYETAIYGYLYANCATGNLRNPVAGQFDLTFADTCFVQGLGYGMGTYITLPAKACSTGTFTGVNIEFNFPASYSQGASPVFSCLRVALGGDATATGSFEDNGFFMELAGFTEGTGNIMSEGTDQAATGSLRIRVGSNVRYLLYTSTQTT